MSKIKKLEIENTIISITKETHNHASHIINKFGCGKQYADLNAHKQQGFLFIC